MFVEHYFYVYIKNKYFIFNVLIYNKVKDNKIENCMKK